MLYDLYFRNVISRDFIQKTTMFTVSDMNISIISDDGVNDLVVAVQAYLPFRGFLTF